MATRAQEFFKNPQNLVIEPRGPQDPGVIRHSLQFVTRALVERAAHERQLVMNTGALVLETVGLSKHGIQTERNLHVRLSAPGGIDVTEQFARSHHVLYDAKNKTAVLKGVDAYRELTSLGVAAESLRELEAGLRGVRVQEKDPARNVEKGGYTR